MIGNKKIFGIMFGVCACTHVHVCGGGGGGERVTKPLLNNLLAFLSYS
jgi:hypothetical protein